ncbi:DUF6232 family protein [Streptomyces sp. NBC_00572]|uniref:DUF6232 family protein n=1 Tax=Streptomyces sp. NBC_00572 TaxID=2903664 RepID=UPI00224FE770|nr:DUF6232 family protein [Streptomyces sp. NBC_00572]MCX4983645.1 DUF6232 family protein [Streptomyces sp. NBC_00572]
MARRKVITVEVSKRVLWIGAEAYPLQNIARATTIKIKPPRARAVGRFVKSLLITGLLAVAALAAAQSDEASGSDRELITRGVEVTAAVLVAAFFLHLIVALLTRTYYALVIETSGNPLTLLTSVDRAEVHQLVRDIMRAVEDPGFTGFTKQMVTYNIGSMRGFYNASGDGAVGRVENNQQSAQDPQAVYEAVIRAIETLRSQVSVEDRAVLDTSLDTIRQGDEAPPGAFAPAPQRSAPGGTRGGGRRWRARPGRLRRRDGLRTGPNGDGQSAQLTPPLHKRQADRLSTPVPWGET